MCYGQDMTPREPMTSKAVRAPVKLWAALQAIADRDDEYLSEVIRAALVEHVKSKGTKKGKS